MNQKFVKILIALITPVITLIVLWIISNLNNRDHTHVNIFVVLEEVADFFNDKKQVIALLHTIYLTAKGFAMGFLAALSVFILIVRSKKLLIVSENLISGWRSIPLTLLIPFVAIMPGFFVYPPGSNNSTDTDPSYLIAIGVFLYMLVGLIEGYKQRSLSRCKYVLNTLRKPNQFYNRHSLFYEVMPKFIPALRISVLFGFVLAIVLEPLIGYFGVGFEIYQLASSKVKQEFAESLALIIIVAYVGVVIDLFISHLSSKFIYNRSIV